MQYGRKCHFRLVFAVGRKVDAASLLERLHWLQVKKKINFKVLLYVIKALNNSTLPRPTCRNALHFINLPVTEIFRGQDSFVYT